MLAVVGVHSCIACHQVLQVHSLDKLVRATRILQQNPEVLANLSGPHIGRHHDNCIAQ